MCQQVSSLDLLDNGAAALSHHPRVAARLHLFWEEIYQCIFVRHRAAIQKSQGAGFVEQLRKIETARIVGNWCFLSRNGVQTSTQRIM
jgi:hypothetical protein